MLYSSPKDILQHDILGTRIRGLQATPQYAPHTSRRREKGCGRTGREGDEGGGQFSSIENTLANTQRVYTPRSLCEEASGEVEHDDGVELGRMPIFFHYTFYPLQTCVCVHAVRDDTVSEYAPRQRETSSTPYRII